MQTDAIIDFPAPDGERNPLAFGQPKTILIAESIARVRSVIREAERHAGEGAWVVGFVSYDAAPAFDAKYAVRRDPDLPLAWFGVFESARVHAAEEAGESGFGRWEPSVGRERFEADISAIRAAIQAGDVYQVNHTLRLRSGYSGQGQDLFRRLLLGQPKAYAAYLDVGRWQVLSVSPELFFRREGEAVTVKPMKGTAGRGRFPEEDNSMAEQLKESEKDRAENLMIVDLLRNDLSRVAQPHTVRVAELFSVETHPTVHQMTSTITAQTKPGTSLDDLFAALFPCGSVTGAPKIKAMEIISALEPSARGIYCGAIGFLKPGGEAAFNVAIRTVVLDKEDRTATCGAGSGIVWDSTSSGEYDEVGLKSRFLEEQALQFSLIETLRMEEGRLVRIDYHLARLAASADYFGRPFDASLCRRKLDELPGETSRVRILLDETGRIEVQVSPLHPVPEKPRFALARAPVSSEDIRLFHKTTSRTCYDEAAAAFPDVFDVLLWNERGELTEFTRGNLVISLEGRHLTPPVACGLLNGCLRQELLDQGKISEARLALADLERAQQIWFINSLRGRVEVFRQGC